MAHYAEIDANSIVLRVVVVSNNEILDENHREQESLGISFCENLFGGTWVQTSYHGNIRKNFAGVGYTYDSQRDAFIPPQPYASWALNETSCKWDAPVAMPDDDNSYIWDEDSLSWQIETEE